MVGSNPESELPSRKTQDNDHGEGFDPSEETQILDNGEGSSTAFAMRRANAIRSSKPECDPSHQKTEFSGSILKGSPNLQKNDTGNGPSDETKPRPTPRRNVSFGHMEFQGDDTAHQLNDVTPPQSTSSQDLAERPDGVDQASDQQPESETKGKANAETETQDENTDPNEPAATCKPPDKGKGKAQDNSDDHEQGDKRE